MMSYPKLKLIVAACEDMGIGLGGKLPWRLREEIKHFAQVTKHRQDPSKRNLVIMGRRTWESIPSKFRPLPDRINVILSSTLQPCDVPDNVIIKQSFDAALKLLQDEDYENAWVIGGSSVYRTALKSEYCHRVYLTKINKKFECDTFLDPIDESKFQVVNDPLVPQDIQEENGITYKFIVYEKLTKA